MNPDHLTDSANILIIEDNLDSLRLLSTVLSEQGYKVRGVVKGQTGLTAAQLILPDLILLDIKLPDLDGYAVCQQLKANEQTVQIPVIFLSALDAVIDKVQAFAVGGVDYITKPFEVEEVLVRIKNQLFTRQLQQQLAQQNDELKQKIQQHQQAEQALQQANEQLQAEMLERQRAKAELGQFFNLSPDLLCLVGADGYFKRLNPAFSKSLGYSDDELLARPFIEFVHPEDRPATLVEFERLLTTTTPTYYFENRYRCQDGSYKWLNWSAVAASSKGLLYAIARNITRQKQQQEALRLIVEGTASTTGDEFFRSCTRHLAEVLQVRYAVVTEVTNAAKNQIRTLAFWNGTDFIDNFEKDISDSPCKPPVKGQMSYYPHHLQEQFPQDLHLVQLAAESYIGAPILDSRGVILGHLAVMDVEPMDPDPAREMILRIFAARAGAELERQRTEHALEGRVKQRTQELQQSEAKFRQMAENIQQVFWITTSDTSQVLYASPAYERIWGRSLEELYEDSMNWAKAIHPYDLDVLEQALERQAQTGEGYDVEYRITRPDGEIRWIRDRSFPIQDESGVTYRMTGIADDITKRKQAEAALQDSEERLRQINTDLEQRVKARTLELTQAKAAAEAANSAKSQFLANMSHELRTPLHAILGFTQLMERDSNLTPSQKDNLETVSRSGEHLLTLINDILEMSKIDSGRVVLTPKVFDLYHLLGILEEMFQLQAHNKGLQLIFERDPAVPQHLKADEHKLRQVLINLLGNAIKFTQQGQVILRVSRTAEEQGQDKSTLHFEVIDTGPGIDPEEFQNIFDPFIQTASGQISEQGTGLGLAISQTFVHLMGGKLSVNSQLGQGATFQFDMQMSLAQASDIQTPWFKQQVVGLAPNQPNYRLLVVEEQPLHCKPLVKLLTSVGFAAKSAMNAQEAISLWQDWHPHLILIDMHLLGVNGYAAAKYIKRSLTKGQKTVIIALTTSPFEEDTAVILAAGCDDFLPKPTTQQVLFDKLAQHLGVRYLYEAAVTTNKKPITPKVCPSPTDLRKYISHMPAEWTEQLLQAAVKGSDQLIFPLLAQIPDNHAPLATVLAEWAKSFQFDKIANLSIRMIDPKVSPSKEGV